MICICYVLWIVSQYAFFRNNKVFDFRRRILDMCSRAAERDIQNEIRDWSRSYCLLNKHSYKAMLYSFKPLKLEKWFTDDEIKILTHGNDD